MSGTSKKKSGKAAKPAGWLKRHQLQAFIIVCVIVLVAWGVVAWYTLG